MRLLVTTPLSVVVDEGDIRHVRGEDETGAFGILPGHADFITVLTVSVMTWRDRSDEEHHVALYGGVLAVRGGSLVWVHTDTEEKEKRAIEILSMHSAHDVHRHEIPLTPAVASIST